VERYISRWRENGRFERGKFGGQRKPIVAEHQALVARLVKADPDMTLGVFQAKLAAAGIQVCAAALHNLLKRLGYSYQKTAGRRRTKAQRRSGATPGMAKVSSRT
jgi:transposase